MLDTSRLPSIIIDPFSPLAFKQEKDTKFRDTVVSILIDSSGSMRGRSICIAAMCATFWAGRWSVARSKLKSLALPPKRGEAGNPESYGCSRVSLLSLERLNDIRHIVYKAADMPWRRARRNLGLMMREELLKENIDGEALLGLTGEFKAALKTAKS